MSAFAEILRVMVERVPGTVGAIFVDWEGEAVDQWGALPPLELQLAGAHWGIVLNQSVTRLAPLGFVEELVIDGAAQLILIRRVTEQYYVVVMAKPGTHLALLRRSVDHGVAGLRAEM